MYVIVRTKSAGVFAGELFSKKTNQAGFFEVVLTNSRRLWKWSGAFTLSELAELGTSNPKECKFSCEVSVHELSQGIEIIEVSEVARKSIAGVKTWQV